MAKHMTGDQYHPRRQTDVDLLEIGLRASAAIRSEEKYAGTWLLRMRLEHRKADTRENAWLPTKAS